MKRTIKFRAWNKEKKIMCYTNEDGSHECWDGVFGSDVEIINHTLKSICDEYEYMQYIGINDKNKAEIYEGDIVRIDGQHELFVVVWVCDTARFGLQSKTQLLYFEFGIGSRIEVAGDKYKNPELLGEGENADIAN